MVVSAVKTTENFQDGCHFKGNSMRCQGDWLDGCLLLQQKCCAGRSRKGSRNLLSFA